MLIIYVVIMLFMLLHILVMSYCFKNSLNPIEAGFSSLNKSVQNSFSVQFMMIILIFVTFDLEILFISSILSNFSILMSIMFCVFITMTLLIEILLNSMKWFL